MNYYLMFHLDRVGNNGIVLRQSTDLCEMDRFINDKFTGREDVFNEYRDFIQEFCLDNRGIIEEENIRNHHNRTGSISLFCRYQNNYGTFMYKIPIIYKNDNKLLSSDSCLKKIKDKLNDDKVLEKLLKEKKFLLSKYEYSLISNYFKFKDIKSKMDFIDSFTNRIKRFTYEKQYFFFRSLMRVCNLNQIELKISKGTINNVNLNMPINTKVETTNDFKVIKNESYSDDDYFTSLVEKNEYDELNKYYDLEIILKDSNINRK